VLGEVEFDFDSDRADILAGATAISANFIQNGAVTAEVRNSGNVVIGTVTTACSTRR
jgi:hypothetical protein